MTLAYVIAGTVLILAGIASETLKAILKGRDDAGVEALRVQALNSDAVPLEHASAAIHRAVKLSADPSLGDDYLERVEALVIDELASGTLPVNDELDELRGPDA